MTIPDAEDMHVVASLFKRYFREMKVPLIPFSFYTPLLQRMASRLFASPSFSHFFSGTSFARRTDECDRPKDANDYQRNGEDYEDLPEESLPVARYLFLPPFSFFSF